MFSWGEDAPRGLGSKTASTCITNAARTESANNIYFFSSQIKELSKGRSVSALIKNNGDAFVIHTNIVDEKIVTGKQKHVKCKEKINVVSCSDDTVTLLSEEGRVFILDTACTPRTMAELCNIQVTQVACGSHHSLALTKGGQVYTWGKNSSGQLGIGEVKATISSPQHLTSLSAVPLLQVTAGGEQSFALSQSGTVICWGKNSSGQLGLGDRTDRHIPTLVHSMNMKKTTEISSGQDHTAILTKGGTVYTFGSGQYGQLGHNCYRDELHPRLVAELWGAKVIKIVCGRHHTLVLTDSKKVYSFGCGEQGQLGREWGRNQSVPLPVQLSHDTIADLKVRHICAGGNASFAMCTVDQEFHAGSTNQNLKETQQCLDEMIEIWTSESGPKLWRKTQKEIERTFSSASFLNGSFLDRSGDKHFNTSPKHSGLNLLLARRAFKKLLKSDKVLEKIESVVLHTLLPSLDEAPLGVEGLRIFLLLTELLRVLQKQKHPQGQSTELTEAVAAAMLRLPPDSLQVLGYWWSSLKLPTMIKHVKLWRNALSLIITKSSITDCRRVGVKNLLKVLQHLYRENDKIVGPQKIAESSFYLEIHFNPFVLADDLRLWRLWRNAKNMNDMPAVICRFPFVMNLQCKIQLFDLNANITIAQHQMNGMYPQTASDKYFELKLKRATLVENTFEQLGETYHIEYKKPLVVYFDEDTKITNVYRNDFFLHLFDELLLPKSGMFSYNDTKTLAWFPSKATLREKQYFLFGVLCGLALYNKNMIHLPFPMVLFKKLVNVTPSLEDLIEFSPQEGKSLHYILEDYLDDDIESLDMCFSIVWDGAVVELDPQNPGKPVTSRNKKEFVDAYVNHAFNKSAGKLFEEFRKGFLKVCDADVVELFRPHELRDLLVGKENYDWEKLKQNTTYEGEYHASHPNILMFWEVFEELTEDEKKAFLLFLTGCDRVPILGMDQIRMRISVLYNSTQQYFPEALTCHSLLELPVYPTKETLQARLTEALMHNRGFLK